MSERHRRVRCCSRPVGRASGYCRRCCSRNRAPSDTRKGRSAWNRRCRNARCSRCNTRMPEDSGEESPHTDTSSARTASNRNMWRCRICRRDSGVMSGRAAFFRCNTLPWTNLRDSTRTEEAYDSCMSWCNNRLRCCCRHHIVRLPDSVCHLRTKEC